MKYYNQLYICI